MTAVNQRMEVWSGDDVVQPVQVVDEYGAPEDLSNPPYTAFTFTVRDKPKGGIMVGPLTLTVGPNGQVVVINATGGLLHIVINSAATATYAVGGRYVDHYQELEGVKGGKVRTLEEGPIRVHQSISGAGV